MTATGLRAAGEPRARWMLLGLVPLLWAAPLQAAGTDFFPAPPAAAVATRAAAGPTGGPSLAASQARPFAIAGRCGISTAAEAVAVNITVVPTTSQGNLSFGPVGSPKPAATT